MMSLGWLEKRRVSYRDMQAGTTAAGGREEQRYDNRFFVRQSHCLARKNIREIPSFLLAGVSALPMGQPSEEVGQP